MQALVGTNTNRVGKSELLTVGQVATRLNVHTNTVRRWAEQGLLNAVRLGPRGDRRFYRSDVEALLQDNHIAAKGPLNGQRS